MNAHAFRARQVSVATLLVGGLLAVAFPHHALSIAQLVALSLAVVAGRHLLASTVPPTGWLSPFKWMSPFGRRALPEKGGWGPDGFESMTSKLSRWRHRFRFSPPMPLDIANLLKSLIREALELGPADDLTVVQRPSYVTPVTWAILTSEQPRGLERLRCLPPDRRKVAEIIAVVLDDLRRTHARRDGPIPPEEPAPQ